ncbi:ABC transporter ATP-binding protein [Alkaliphilus serpentinus]|uniref:ABC transporter ATP-binding protein n=1 Tax=Alkaliphilus serpentinus TaxID=1482731 RepID=A0A833M9Q8_9FIRM|nr:ABC transporter ATP-binding protein [Alkaliphilus serpentinus]KAB3529155.1 ABC transporter ATP-binding protein [Alkaliphilus serpentinus]
MNSIDINNLTFKYGETAIVDRLSLNIREGSFISIIGPNGSGKSTLLKIIAKNLLPQEGVVLINGKEVSRYKAKDLAKEIGVVPQDTLVSYDFSVEDIVLMGRYPHLGKFQQNSLRDMEIAKEAMIKTNTWHLRERNINEISGGERQRVIIAKAIVQEPRIILLDEPTSSLDIHHQLEVLELLKNLNNKLGVTIVAVLHDMNLAARYSNEIILLNRGMLIASGKTQEVLTVDHLKRAYEMDMIIETNIYTGTLQVHPIAIKNRAKKNKSLRIHIVCGGGSGKELIQALYDGGYKLSVGVVNEGDSDWHIAKLYDIEVVEEVPFSEISPSSLEKAKLLADAADLIIMTDIPIGWGNIKNLEILREQLQDGKTVYYFKYPQDKKYDYTGGNGLEVLKNLKDMGLKGVDGIEKFLELLNKRG